MTTMRLLAFETSTKYLVLSITDGERILGSQSRLVDRESQTFLPETMERCLKEARLPLEKIDAFAVGLGPGSFTGLRIGITFVKGLAFATEKPVAGVPTLDLLALNAPPFSGQVVPVLDAKKQQVYWARYRRREDEGLKKLGAYAVGPLEGLIEELEGEVFFVGDGARLYEKEIRSVRKIQASFGDPELDVPKPEALACLAMREALHGRWIKPEALEPLYLHPRECTITGKLALPQTGKPIRVEIK